MINVCTSNFTVNIFLHAKLIFIFSPTKKVYHVSDTSKPVRVMPVFMEAQ